MSLVFISEYILAVCFGRDYQPIGDRTDKLSYKSVSFVAGIILPPGMERLGEFKVGAVVNLDGFTFVDFDRQRIGPNPSSTL